jgi:hypothetical protein
MPSTFALTIGGTSRIANLQKRSLQIVRAFGRRSVFNATFFSTDGSWNPSLNQELIWTVDGTASFGGYIREITELGHMTTDTNDVFFQVSAGDYGSLLEDIYLTTTFPAGDTLEDWLDQYVSLLTGKGITVDAGQATGPTMTEALQVDRVRADVVLQQFLLRSGWLTKGVSPSKTLELFASGTEVAPFNITSSNDKAIGDIQVSPLWNGQKYNRVIIKFGPPGVTEYFYQDVITVSGTPTSVTLSYTPVGWVPVVAGASFGYAYLDSSVNGRDTVAVDPSPFSQGYEYFPATNTIKKWNGAAFTNGEVLTIPYDFRYPIELIAETGAAATNPIELLIVDPNIRTSAEAQIKGDAILAIVSTDTARVRYFTHDDGLEVGQTQNVNVPERDFNDDTIITDIRTRDTPAASASHRLIHEIITAQGDQPKRSDLDAVLQWSIMGGSGGVAGTAPNSSGGFTVPPFDTYVLFNDNMTMGAAAGLDENGAGDALEPYVRPCQVHPLQSGQRHWRF